jgi:hypothetical protein
MKTYTCQICSSNAYLYGILDFNKVCHEELANNFPKTKILINYFLCEYCKFCFAPEFLDWSDADFKNKIYDDQYILIDPGHAGWRAQENSKNIIDGFKIIDKIKHLDYGGGNGLFCEILRSQGWDSENYDPFYDGQIIDIKPNSYNFITAFEVFEHMPFVNKFMLDMVKFCSDDAIILFTTLLSDGNIHEDQDLDWWYAAPRNGHISLFSKKSLQILAQKNGFQFGSFSNNFHIFFKEIPSWASQMRFELH